MYGSFRTTGRTPVCSLNRDELKGEEEEGEEDETAGVRVVGLEEWVLLVFVCAPAPPPPARLLLLSLPPLSMRCCLCFLDRRRVRLRGQFTYVKDVEFVVERYAKQYGFHG